MLCSIIYAFSWTITRHKREGIMPRPSAPVRPILTPQGTQHTCAALGSRKMGDKRSEALGEVRGLCHARGEVEGLSLLACSTVDAMVRLQSDGRY